MNKLFILIIILISLFFIKNFLVNNNRFLEYNVENFYFQGIDAVRYGDEANNQSIPEIDHAALARQRELRVQSETDNQNSLNELQSTLESYQTNPPIIPNISNNNVEGISGITDCDLADISNYSPDEIQNCINNFQGSLIYQLKNNLNTLVNTQNTNNMIYLITKINGYSIETLKLLLSMEAGNEVFNLNYMAKYKSNLVFLGPIDKTSMEPHGVFTNIRIVETPEYKDCEGEMIYKVGTNGCNWKPSNPTDFKDTYNNPLVFDSQDMEENTTFRDLRYFYVPIGFMAKITIGKKDARPQIRPDGKNRYDKTSKFRDGSYFLSTSHDTVANLGLCDRVWSQFTLRFWHIGLPWVGEELYYCNLGENYSNNKWANFSSAWWHGDNPNHYNAYRIDVGEYKRAWIKNGGSYHDDEPYTEERYHFEFSPLGYRPPPNHSNVPSNVVAVRITERSTGYALVNNVNDTYNGGGGPDEKVTATAEGPYEEIQGIFEGYRIFDLILSHINNTNTVIPMTKNGDEPRNLYLRGGKFYSMNVIKQYLYSDIIGTNYKNFTTNFDMLRVHYSGGMTGTGGKDGFDESDIYIKEIKICRDPDFCESLLHKSTTDYMVDNPTIINPILNSFGANTAQVQANKNPGNEFDYKSAYDNERFKYFTKWSDIICRYNTSSLPENRPEPSRWSSFNPENGYYKPNSDWKIKRHFT